MSDPRTDQENEIFGKQDSDASKNNRVRGVEGDYQSGSERHGNGKGGEVSGGRSYSDWDDSRVLVPSSLELGPGSVDRYVISKQIVRM